MDQGPERGPGHGVVLRAPSGTPTPTDQRREESVLAVLVFPFEGKDHRRWPEYERLPPLYEIDLAQPGNT